MYTIFAKKGRYGKYGGRFVPETLINALNELELQFNYWRKKESFTRELDHYLIEYAGRPTPMYEAKRLAEAYRLKKILLKREDLCHTGAHKINNCVGQVLLAIRMGKERIVAETGAGQHGVAVASVCAKFGLKCIVYMGQADYERQHKNVLRMKILGADVIPVKPSGSTLKEAINEAIRDWVSNVDNTFYLLGSVVGPHPYPTIVSYFQSVIGKEAKKQIIQLVGKYPDAVIACVGGGSNSIGIFSAFLNIKEIDLYAVEAGGCATVLGKHAATLCYGTEGILHGSLSYLLQNDDGQVAKTHSISAGLDYPGVGPLLSFLKNKKRIMPVNITDEEAMTAFYDLSKYEGIIPALEPAHAIAYAKKLAQNNHYETILINLSGRGDKDLDICIKN